MNENIATFSADDRIITKDEPADHAYRIISGSVRVFLDKDNKDITLAELGEGAIFGESALFEGTKYGAHVDAVTDVELEVISPGIFQEKLEHADPLLKSMFELLIERQRITNQALLDSETREFMDIMLV